MGAADRKSTLRDIADLLAYARTRQMNATYAHIFQAIHDKLEDVQNDVEESAENLEERFPDRADDLRSNYEWVEGALNQAEDAVGEVLDSDVPVTLEDASTLAESIESDMESIELPHRTPPRLSLLLEGVKAPVEEPTEVSRSYLQRRNLSPEQSAINRGRSIFSQLSDKDLTLSHIRKLRYDDMVLTAEEYLETLHAAFVWLDNVGQLSAFDKFFEHETTIQDIQVLTKESAMQKMIADTWINAVTDRSVDRERKQQRPDDILRRLRAKSGLIAPDKVASFIGKLTGKAPPGVIGSTIIMLGPLPSYENLAMAVEKHYSSYPPIATLALEVVE